MSAETGTTIMAILILSIMTMMLIRNYLCFRIITRRIDMVGNAARAAIMRGEEWEHMFNEFGPYNHFRMVLDLTKWTYEQFYGRSA